MRAGPQKVPGNTWYIKRVGREYERHTDRPD